MNRLDFLEMIVKSREYEDLMMQKEKREFYRVLSEADIPESEKSRIRGEIDVIFTDSELHFDSLGEMQKKLMKSDKNDW